MMTMLKITAMAIKEEHGGDNADDDDDHYHKV